MKYIVGTLTFLGIIILLGALGIFFMSQISFEKQPPVPATPTVQDPIPNQEVTDTEQDAQIAALPVITTIVSSTLASSTTELMGEALGTWYFEASFPIDVLDSNNQVVEVLIATAQTDWMTTSSVAFVAPFTASQYTGQTITFILKKDNPSGEPQFDESMSIGPILVQ